MFLRNLIRQTLQGRYRIEYKLGEGGIGETYLAVDTSKFNEPCVIKRLKPQNKTNIRWVQQAFEQEAQMLKKLGKHPQIPDLLAYFQEQQEFFLVQEYIDGMSLRSQIYPGNQWQENSVIFLLQHILEVLEFVHQNGIIHRDLKPENIIIKKKDNEIVLIDFGAVKQISTQVFNTQGKVTASTAIVGTPGYMPVEQMRGNPTLGSDVYALGMIGIEALTGVFPTDIPLDSNNLELVWRNQAQVTNKTTEVLNKMVRYHSSKRYQSASETLPA
ncbi:MAG: serine/threonine-protein kinase, partial [Spirulinaceae cyanobacterium]